MPTTIWSLQDAKKKHHHSPGLAEVLSTVFPPETPVLDLGCGCGFYLNRLSQIGYTCLGVKGTQGIAEIAFFPDIVQGDLSRPLDIQWPRSSILCLEVAEHLFPEQEPQLLATIVAYCANVLVLSWAIPGQRGHGPHNCRNNDYVKERMVERGFIFDADATSRLRVAADTHTRWFKNTLLVFHRDYHICKDGRAELGGL